MNAELSHRDAKRLFLQLADDDLAANEEAALRLHLDGCEDCRKGWVRYEKTVKSLRRTEREKAPPHLSSQIMRRVRRQRLFGWRGTVRAHHMYRVPVESVIPVLLGVAVAAWILFAA